MLILHARCRKLCQARLGYVGSVEYKHPGEVKTIFNCCYSYKTFSRCRTLSKLTFSLLVFASSLPAAPTLKYRCDRFVLRFSQCICVSCTDYVNNNPLCLLCSANNQKVCVDIFCVDSIFRSLKPPSLL